MTISKGLVPPGGWKYRQSVYWIAGNTFDELVMFVRQHRISNSLPIGDVEQDVENQIAERFPQLVIN